MSLNKIVEKFLLKLKVCSPRKKTWSLSQNFELRHAIIFMEQPSFKNLFNEAVTGQQKISQGYINELILKEFFNNSRKEWTDFVNFIKNKKCLDIGPCVFSPLLTWDVASKRYVVEPLYHEISEWQKKNLGQSAFEDMTCFGQKGEKLIPDLVGEIDGAIYCRNVLDHTPTWPFILSAISSYATKGAKLLLWNDIDHRGTADAGHYDITADVDSFKRLINQFGFKIIREYQDKERDELNWGCFAEKSAN